MWCADNNLVLTRTKEVNIDVRRTRGTTQSLLCINGVALVDSVRFNGIHVTKDLTWTLKTSNLVKELELDDLVPQQLKKLLQGWSTMESILC